MLQTTQTNLQGFVLPKYCESSYYNYFKTIRTAVTYETVVHSINNNDLQ